MVTDDAMFVVAVDGRLDVNVALNRPSYQVSTYTDGAHPYNYAASYANDGSHGTNMNSGPCSVTLYAVNPWWAVDLLVSLFVAGVKFTNRDSSGTSADPYLYGTTCASAQLSLQ